MSARSHSRQRREGVPDPLADLAHAIRVLAGRPALNQEVERFGRYLRLLLLWNRTHRLTALGSAAAIVRGLFQDSLLFLPRLPARPLALVDIGAGAGIPGVPLRIVDPGISLTMVESRRKRVSFLSALKRELDLADVRILEGRAESLVAQLPELQGAFDVAVSRGAGSLHDIVPIALRYLRPGGLVVVSGPPSEAPLPSAPPFARGGWEQIHFPALGITRVFFEARRPD